MRRVVGIFWVVLLSVACDGPRQAAETRVEEALGGVPAKGYARAITVREFEFPTDHGPHPDHRNEWWYVTGNLLDEAGQRYGFQLTIFRIALSPEPVTRASDWGTRQAYMAHFALTDVGSKHFHAFDRFSRGAAGLSGADRQPFRVWLEDWEMAAPMDDRFPWRIRAEQDDVAIDLTLTPVKPPVLQGDRGLSRKSAEPGNASYYYSIPRMAAQGILTVGGRTHQAEGTAWLDREWSTSALGEGQVGWDWFALQLDDGTDVMYYQLRREDGSIDPHSAGSVIPEEGRVLPLTSGDVELRVLETWQSPHGGRYPSVWQMHIRPLDLTLRLSPVLPDQELAVSVRYWEGAVDIEGVGHAVPVSGWGYMELTGYSTGGAGPGLR